MTARGYAARAVRVIVDVMWMEVMICGGGEKAGKWSALYTYYAITKGVVRAPDNLGSRVFHNNNRPLWALVSLSLLPFPMVTRIYLTTKALKTTAQSLLQWQNVGYGESQHV